MQSTTYYLIKSPDKEALINEICILRSFHVKEPPEVFCEKRSFQRFLKLHRETPVLKSLLNIVGCLKVCNFIKNWLQHRCFPVKFMKFLRTPILKNTVNDCFCFMLIHSFPFIILLLLGLSYFFAEVSFRRGIYYSIY